ncbi:MAG: vitamin K epoxide reductase family protein [Chloroflexota bacterium]
MTMVREQQASTLFTAKNLALLLIVIGLVISSYLSYVKLADVPIICSENQTFSCGTVQASRWSELFGIPIAYLGFGLYAVLGLLLIFEDYSDFLAEYGRVLVFIGVIVGWLFSMWLVYVQFFIILALCQWCLAHEANFTILFGVILYLTWEHLQNEE